jgi:hypothetical protein
MPHCASDWAGAGPPPTLTCGGGRRSDVGYNPTNHRQISAIYRFDSNGGLTYEKYEYDYTL